MRGIFNGSRGLFAGFVARDTSTSCLMQEDGEVIELFFKNPRFIQLSVFESGDLENGRKLGSDGAVGTGKCLKSNFGTKQGQSRSASCDE